MRSSERGLLGKLDGIASTGVRIALACVWPTLVAIALGATLFGATHADLLPATLENQLARRPRLIGLGFFVGSLAAVAVLYWAALRYPKRDNSPSALDRARRLHPYLSFLLSGPAILALTMPGIEKAHPWLTWLYIAIAVLAWFPSFQAWSTRRTTPGKTGVLSSRQLDILSLVAVFALWVAYSTFFARLAITNHHAFNTRMLDLGIYDNVFFLSSHGEPLGSTLSRGGTHASSHFDPILVLLSPLYLLWPRAELLLALQSIWCGAGVIPAYLLGRNQLDSRAWGLVLALVYALHPALQGANLYEFHSLTLLFSPLLFALYFLLAGNFRLYFGTLALLLLIREDVPILMCFVGLYGVIAKEPSYKRVGWITILVSLVYLVLARTVFMPTPDLFNEGAGAHGYSYYYSEMVRGGAGATEFVTTLLTNPAFVVKLVAQERKLHYLLVLFFPVLFLPSWAGRARVMLLFGLMFTLLASEARVFTPYFQYSAFLVPIAIALAPLGLRRLRESRSTTSGLTAAVMGCVLVASLLVSWKYGGIVENSRFKGGYMRVARSLTAEQQERYDSFVELVSQIEPDASVSVTDNLGAHVSNRAEVYRLEKGVDTDYLLVHDQDLKGRTAAAIQGQLTKDAIQLVGREHEWSLYRALARPRAD